MDMIAQAVTNVTVRIVARYLIGALVALGVATGVEGAALVGSPEVQTVLSLLVGGVIAWLVERATVLARRYGGSL